MGARGCDVSFMPCLITKVNKERVSSLSPASPSLQPLTNHQTSNQAISSYFHTPLFTYYLLVQALLDIITSSFKFESLAVLPALRRPHSLHSLSEHRLNVIPLVSFQGKLQSPLYCVWSVLALSSCQSY